jgi:hypothetical protein
MFNISDEQFVVESQEIQEEQIILRFEFSRIQVGPHVRALIMCQLGFGVVAIVRESRQSTSWRYCH